MSFTPRTRQGDPPTSRAHEHRRLWWLRENWYRDLWLLIITLALMYLGALALDNSNQAKSMAARNQQFANNLAQFGFAAVQQNINARYDDCEQLNSLRNGLDTQVKQSYKTLPLLYRLVPSLHTPAVEKIEQNAYQKELREFSGLDCTSYAKRAIPPGDSHRYQIP